MDLLKDNVDGAFYAQQLKSAPNPTNGDYWQVEKILKTKIEKKQKFYFVKFLFYPGNSY